MVKVRMQKLVLYSCLTANIFACSSTTSLDTSKVKQGAVVTISKIEMHLSAFGVEADDFPSIDVTIDFARNSSKCIKSYFDPAFKGSIYQLSSNDIDSISTLLHETDFEKLKARYRVSRTDQPTSTLVVYTSEGERTIEDYGLEGDHPLPELYKLVYKF